MSATVVPKQTEKPLTVKDRVASELSQEGVKVEGSPSDFIKKFNKEKGVKPDAAPPEKTEQSAVKPPPPAVDPPEAKETKPHSFVEKTIGEKKALEQKVQDLENKTIPGLNDTISDLKKQLEGSGSAAETKRLQQELTAAQNEKKAAVETLETSNRDLRENLDKANKRLEFVDFPNTPAFKETYEKPLAASIKTITGLIGSETSLMADLDKVWNAANAVLSNPDPAEKARQEELRDELIDGIAGRLKDFRKGRFTSAINDMLSQMEERHMALVNHEETKKVLTAQERERSDLARQATQKRWGDAMTETGEAVKKETEIPEDIMRVISEHKIDIDTSGDEAIALATIKDGGSSFQPEDVTRLLNQGRYYKRALGIISAKDKIIAELQDTIKSLGGSVETRGNGDLEKNRRVTEEKKPEGLKGFLSDFANRKSR